MTPRRLAWKHTCDDLNTYYVDCTLDVGTDGNSFGRRAAQSTSYNAGCDLCYYEHSVVDGQNKISDRDPPCDGEMVGDRIHVARDRPYRQLLLTKSALRLTMRAANVKSRLRVC